MNPLAWTSLIVLFLLILVTLVDKTLGRGTFYLFTAIFLTSLAYVRTLLFDQSARKKLTLPLHLFTTSQGATVDWSPYLPQIPRTLTTLPPEASLKTEVAALADKITENYISSWYQFIGDDPNFLLDVRKIVNAALYKLVTEYLPKVNVDALVPEVIKILNGHVRGKSGEVFTDENKREQLLSKFSEWILIELGPSDLLQLRSIKCSSTQKRDASYYLLEEILAKGALKGVIDALSEPRVIIRSIIKLLYGNKEEALALYLGDIKDGNEMDVEDGGESIAVIPKILVSSPASAKDHPSKVDAHQMSNQEEPGQINTSIKEGPSILERLTEKLRFPLSTEQLNRSRSHVDPVTGIEKGIEATESSGDLKLISNIRIEETKKATAKGDSHIIYKVVYDGLFEEIEANINSFKPVCSCIVRKEVSVWRRFSTFVSLHEQLESDRKMRSNLKNVRSPSRLKTVLIFESKLEKSITQTRSRFLTKYLNDLAAIPVICNSRDFRAFMEYGNDCDDPHRRSLLDGSSPELTLKLEKMVTGGIKNVVSAVKKVLPTESYQEGIFSAFLSSCPTRNVVPVLTGDFTQLDEGLRSMEMSNRYCLFFPTKDDSYSSYDFTPSPSPLSASISSKSSYFTHNFNCNSNSKNHISKCNSRKRKSQERITEPTVDFVEMILTQKLQCTWWALAVKVFLSDLLESYFNALKSLCLDKISFPCLLNLLHSTLWPDECSIATEAGEDATATDQDDLSRHPHSHSHPQAAAANSPLDLLKRSAWILDLLSIDFDSVLPFLVEKFSSKDANVTLIYNLINTFFARLKIDSSPDEGVV